MSKRENHWYLVGASAQMMRRGLRPRAWQIGVGLLVGAMLLMFAETGGLEIIAQLADLPAFVPVVTILIAGLGLGIGIIVGWRRRERARSGYWKALQHPGPDEVIDEVVRSLQGAKLLPDLDAFSAQSKAIAYALYGRGGDAASALDEIDWKARAPLIQAVGLSAEGIIELLCKRDPERALELNRKARALASISAALPGAAQSEKYHATCVAVGEAVSNALSPASLQCLEESARDGRYPPLQLIASLGLAIALERSGQRDRAKQLRAFLRQAAPHAASLHLEADDFSAAHREPSAEREPPFTSRGPVSTAVMADNGTGAAVYEHAAKRKLVRMGGRLVGLWAVLILMFLATWIFLERAK